jgi:pyridoxine 4-dehydrogenase
MTPVLNRDLVESAGEILIGGDLPVHRLGFGALWLAGRRSSGEPEDPDRARALLRRVIERGVTFIDTSDAYGPEVSERFIGETLSPYPSDLVIATKGGIERKRPGDGWPANGRPEYLRRACEASLRRLKLERVDLYQLHTIDPRVPLEESLGELVRLQNEGKIRHIGVSNFDVDELRSAVRVARIVSVQNRYNLDDRDSDDVLAECERMGMAFFPWRPLATGILSEHFGPLRDAMRQHNATAAQIAIAWLLRRSPVMLPIPGTSSIRHLEENVMAAGIQLSDEEMAALSRL